MAKRYYWLKLKADWFSDKRIKKLRSIAGGDFRRVTAQQKMERLKKLIGGGESQ